MKPLARLRTLFRRKKIEAEMAAEMRTHLELQAARYVAAGMDPEEARYAAQREFGNLAVIQEQVRAARGWLWLEQLAQDFRFAVRSLRRNPAFSVAVVAILALGIGASTALFSVVYGVLIDPYPYAKSGEIWAPGVTGLKDGRGVGFRVRDYLEMSRLPGVATAMATRGESATLSGDPFPDVIWAVRLSGTAFSFLGVPPVLGRGIAPSDILPNGDVQPVTVLSYQLWQRRFNGDPGVIGRTIAINHQPHAIIGVMPPRFGWYGDDSLWVPLPTTDLEVGVNPILRLKPGVSRETVEQQLLALYRQLARETPARYPADGFKATLFNYLDVTVANGAMRDGLLTLVGAVGFLMLIACTNVANLQLARGATRSREIAVRLAIGASRGRLARQLLTESVALSLVAGALGVLLALAFTRFIVVLLPPNVVPNEARVAINGWALGFSLVLSAVTGILSGLMPGWQSTRPDLNAALKDGGAGAGGSVRSSRTRNALVVVEVALSVILLVGATVATRSFLELFRHDWGFRAEKLLVVRVPLPAERYTTFVQRNAFARDLLGRLQTVPGVVAAAVGNLPFNSGGLVDFSIPGHPTAEGHKLGGSLVSADFRSTFGLTLRSGRDLSESEVAHGDPVALISETTAKFWPAGESPLGRTIEIAALAGPSAPDNLAPATPAKILTVVGVVGDTRNANFRADPPPAIYVPYTLRGFALQQFIVRTSGPPLGVLSAVRAEVRALDPDLPLRRPITVEEIMGQQTALPRFNMTLFDSLAVAALGLAAVGLYSLLSFNVAQRTREIGVRMALGAERHRILFLIFGLAGRLVGLGLLLGMGGSFWLMKAVQNKIPDLPALDAVTASEATLLLGSVALLACWLPAHRAARVNPMIALRAE